MSRRNVPAMANVEDANGLRRTNVIRVRCLAGWGEEPIALQVNPNQTMEMVLLITWPEVLSDRHAPGEDDLFGHLLAQSYGSKWVATARVVHCCDLAH